MRGSNKNAVVKKLEDHLYNLNMTDYSDISFAAKLELTVRQATHSQLTISMFGPVSMFPNPRKTAADPSDSYSAGSSPYVTSDLGFLGRFAPYGYEL